MLLAELAVSGVISDKTYTGHVDTHTDSEHVCCDSERCDHFACYGQAGPYELCSNLPGEALFLIIIRVPTVFNQRIPSKESSVRRLKFPLRRDHTKLTRTALQRRVGS